MNLLYLQPVNVPDTFANVDHLLDQHDYKPSTSVEVDVGKFLNWYQQCLKQLGL